METKKMLDKNGLEYYTGKIKAKIPTKTSQLTNDSGFTNNTGTITQVKLDGTNVATSGVANVQAIPINFATSSVSSVAGTIVDLKKYGNVNYNGSLIGTNLLNLSVNRFYHCYERGATITCNYFSNANFFCDGGYSGHYPTVNPSTQFGTTPFVLEIKNPSSYEMTDVSRLLIIGHRLTGSLMATKYKIEVAYAYSGGTYSWDTVIDYEGTAVNICQKLYGLYCSDQGSTSAPWHRIFGVRLTISGSTSTIFQIADIQLICGRGTEQPYEAIHTVSDAGGTFYGEITATKFNGTSTNASKTTGALTIQKNGTQIGDTFNGSANKTINIGVPTKVSELTNDSGYTSNTGTITGITMNGASKGTSGVVNLGTVITSHQDISGKQDKITSTNKLDYSLLSNTPTIPTKTSDITNDSGFISNETDPVFSASAASDIVSSDITNWNSKQAALVSGTNIKTINNASVLGSGNINIEAGACVEQSSTAPTDTDIVLWIEDSDIDGSGGGGGTSIEVIDSLISTSTTDALSANQGRVLNGKITTIESNYLTSTNIKDNLTTDSATDALSAKQGKVLDTRVSALEGDNLDSRLDTLEGQNLDTRLDTIEAKNLVESTNISKIVMVTEYPSTPDPDTLYVKVASL